MVQIYLLKVVGIIPCTIPIHTITPRLNPKEAFHLFTTNQERDPYSIKTSHFSISLIHSEKKELNFSMGRAASPCGERPGGRKQKHCRAQHSSAAAPPVLYPVDRCEDYQAKPLKGLPILQTSSFLFLHDAQSQPSPTANVRIYYTIYIKQFQFCC